MSKEITPLEALENIKKRTKVPYFSVHYDSKKYQEDLGIIEKELKDYYALKKECEEAKWYQEHKALEIIKEKKINVMLFITIKHMGLKRYNECFDAEEHQLTQEEYELLKEVLL